MDLFTVTARMVLDASEYMAALRKAEREASHLDSDVHSDATLDTSDFEAGLDTAEHRAGQFKNNYSELESEAAMDTENFVDAVDGAEEKAVNFQNNADVDAAATMDETDFSNGVDNAITKSEEFDRDHADIEGSADIDTSKYISGVDEAERTASGADADVDADARMDAQSFLDEVSNMVTEADDFDADYGEIESMADLDGDDFSDGVSNLGIDAEDFLTDYGSLSSTASLETGDFSSALTSTTSDANLFSAGMQDIFGKLAAGLTAAGIVGIIKKIGGALIEAINGTAEYADQVDKASRAMSMSTEDYQVWQHALSQSGASMNDVKRGWRTLSDAIVDAKNKTGDWAEETEGDSKGAEKELSDLQKAFNTLGVDPTQFETTESLFDTVISKLAQMESGTERDNLVTAIFGRGGTQLNALLDSGVEGIEDLKKEAKELGLIMTDEEITNAVAYGDAVANMNDAINAVKQNLVSGLIPFLTDAVKLVTDLVAFFNGRTHQELSLGEEFQEIEKSMNDAFNEAEAGETKTKTLIDKLFEMSDATGKCKGNLEVWKAVAEELIQTCPELATQIDLESGSIRGQKDDLYDLCEAWFANARAQAVAQSLQDKQNAIADKQRDLIDKQIEAELKQADAAGQLSLARQKANELVGKLGLSDVEGFTAEDIAGMDANQLFSFLQNLASSGQELSENWDSGLFGDAQTSINNALQLTQEAENLNNQVATLETELQTAAEEYERYAQTANDYLSSLKSGIEQIPETKEVTITVNTVDGTKDGEHAKGLNYVPYDEYNAVLHRGEMVLNRAQAEDYRGGASGGADIGGVVADAVREGLSGLVVALNGGSVARIMGDAVTDRVNQNIGGITRRGAYGLGGG